MGVHDISQASSTVSSTTGRYYIVVDTGFGPEDKVTNGQLSLLQEAYLSLTEHGAAVRKCDSLKVMTLKQKTSGVAFVVPNFRCEAFSHLNSMGFRIYGPLAIVQSFQKVSKIISAGHPLFSLTMYGVEMTSTGLDADTKESIMDKARQMGALYTANFLETTTHLVSVECASRFGKYDAAVERQIPVVFPTWVDAAWEAAQNNDMVYSAIDNCNEHTVPIFAKCVITCSGFTPDERYRIAQLVKENGGTFSGEMDRATCTHLVINSTTGLKYKRAQEWGTIHIVRIKWLMKSVTKMIRLPEKSYPPGQKCSTQNENNATLNDPGMSAILPSHPSRNNTTTSTGVSRSNSTTSLVSGANPAKVPMRKSVIRRNDSQLSMRQVDPVEEFDFTTLHETYGTFLEQCRILFFEIQKANTLKLYRRLANCGGCTIVESVDQNPTHMIVPPGQYSPNHYARICQAHDAGIDVVKPEWLIESVKQQQFLDVAQFLFDLPSTSKVQNLSSRSGAFMSVVVEQEKAPSTPSMASSLMDSRNDITRVTNLDEEDNNQSREDQEEQSRIDEAVQQVYEELSADQVDNQVEEEIVPNEADTTPTVDEQANETGSLKVVEINEKDPVEEEEQPPVAIAEVFPKQVVSDPVPRRSQFTYSGSTELNLSMPLDAYICGNRPVKFRFRESELMQFCQDTLEEAGESENTTILLSKGLTNAAKNTCPSESFYEKAMGPNLNSNPTSSTPTQASIVDEIDREIQANIEKKNLIPADLRERLSRAARTSTSLTENKENETTKSVDSLKMPESEMVHIESQVVTHGQITWDCRFSTQEIRKLPAKKPSIASALDSDEPYFGADSDDTFTTFAVGNVESNKEKKTPNEGNGDVENEKSTSRQSEVSEKEAIPQEQPETLEKEATLKVQSRNSEKELTPQQQLKSSEKESTCLEKEPTPQQQGRTSEKEPTPVFTDIAPKGPVPEADSFNATWPDEFPVQPKNISQLRKPQIIGLEDSADEDIEAENTGQYVAGLVNIRSQTGKSQEVNTVQLIEEVHDMSIRSNPTVKANENEKTPDSSTKENQNQEPSTLRRSQRQKRKKRVVSTDSEESSQTPAKRSSRSTGRINSVSEEQKQLEESVKTISIPGTPIPITKHIMLTGFELKEASNLSEMIAELNGTLLDDTINLEITDLIVAKRICKSEKLVSGIASGKKIVSMNYIVKSMQCGKWLDEDLYEYGNPKAKRHVSIQSESEKNIAEAAYRWRLKIKATDIRPFEKWRVVCFLDPNVCPQYVRIIKSGGGYAICGTDAPVNFQGFTHAILGNKNTMVYVNKERLRKLADLNIPFYSEQIIMEYLLCMPPESALTKYHSLHAEFHRRK